ncbi:MAG: cytochrome c oxidase subunit II [Alicyclobacillus sp.]|nr:cytochrome c oxidase subunit II [Alicyclobacillus sp.]
MSHAALQSRVLLALQEGGLSSVLKPAGPVAGQELKIIAGSLILTMIVVVPVIVMFAAILWRYRDRQGNTARYDPEWSESKVLEVIWWGIPIVIIGVLGAYTAKVTYALTKPPETKVKPLTIDVTSLDWKWLFEYPDQGVATVNELVIPVGVPVSFDLTADGPMNSFWIPSLGGQEYAMPGMVMRLWLEATRPGVYYGHAANFTGQEFAGMQFKVVATSSASFSSWVRHVQRAGHPLTLAIYRQLRQPSEVGEQQYSSYPRNLFADVVWREGGQYMAGSVPSLGSTHINVSPAMANMGN